MAAIFPTVVPTGYDGDASDFLVTKCDRSGASRITIGTVTVPASSTAGTIIGLMPFNRGMRVGYGSSCFTAQLDSTNAVTLSVGYQYSDSATLVAASSTNAFVDASTLVAASGGGQILFNKTGGYNFVAAGDGWIVGQTATGTTTAAGAIKFNLITAYDQGGTASPIPTT